MATIRWNELTGDWTTAADWDIGVVPTSGDDVFFDSGISGYTITISSAVSAASLTFTDIANLSEAAGASLTLSGTLRAINGAVLELDGATTVGGLVVLGGAITGFGDITDTSAFSWSTGTIGGTAPANAVLTIDGDVDLTGSGDFPNGVIHHLQHRTLDLAGATTLNGQGNGFLLIDGAVINNSGTFITENDNGAASSQSITSSDTGTFNNTGTFIKNNVGNSGETDISSLVVFNNTNATVEVDAGTLAINGGGISTNSDFMIAAGASLLIGRQGYGFDAGSSISGDGTILFTDTPSSIITAPDTYDVNGATKILGATVIFDHPVTSLGSLTLDGSCVLTGTQDLTTTDPFIWSAGTIAGSGASNAVFTVAGDIDLNADRVAGAIHTLDHRTLDLSGTTVMSGQTNGFQINNGAVINNAGHFFTENDNGGQQGIFATLGTGTFNNTGTFIKDNVGNSGVTDFSTLVDIINAGTMEVDAGTLKIDSPVTGPGQFVINGPQAVLELDPNDPSAPNVTFGANLGMLRLDNPLKFAGVISGFIAGDVIDVVGTSAATILSFDGTILTLSLSSSPQTVRFTFAGADQDLFGIASDGHGNAEIIAVNHAPSFTGGADQTVNEDAGAQSVPGWASSIFAGAANETSQPLDFVVSNDNPGLFGVAPTVAADGTLTYTPAADANGNATVTVKLHDAGGTAGGGSDTSAPQTFTITVAPVNDAPAFTEGVDQAIGKNAAAQTVAGWARNISAGPANEAGQQLDFLVSNDNPALFVAAPHIAADGTLTYTAAPDASGLATVTVQLHDDGGTANGGSDISASQSFIIAIDAVNEAPVNTVPGALALTENGTAAIAGLAVADADAGSGIVTTTLSVVHGTLTVAAHDGVSVFGSGTDTLVLASKLAHLNPTLAAPGNIIYAPQHDYAGTDTLTMTTSDNGNTGSGGALTDTDHVTITIAPADHAPAPPPHAGSNVVLWQNADGTPAMWLLNGSSLGAGANVGFNPGAAWHEIGLGDFNGDGQSDILWQNTDGSPAVWLMNGLNLLGGANVGFNPGPSWHVVGSGDFDGDGKADILWQNQSGQAAVWLMDGLNLRSGGDVGPNPGPSWHAIGSGDFNGDGKADILWQNSDGTPAIWLMNGRNLIGGANVGVNPGPDWHVQAAADFNGDGKADILWQNANGQAAVWLMDGQALIHGDNVGFNPGAAWQVHGTGDFNGDGKADIAWQNLDGTPAVWLLDGFNLLAGSNVGFDPGTNWHVVPPHHDALV